VEAVCEINVSACDLAILVDAARDWTCIDGELDIGLAERSSRQAERANPRTYQSFCEHICNLPAISSP